MHLSNARRHDQLCQVTGNGMAQFCPPCIQALIPLSPWALSLLQVLTKLGPVLGEAVVGIAMLPVVFYQLTQIMWESVMVSRWLASDRAEERAMSPGQDG